VPHSDHLVGELIDALAKNRGIDFRRLGVEAIVRFAAGMYAWAYQRLGSSAANFNDAGSVGGISTLMSLGTLGDVPAVGTR
jgi:hypothetical protein